MRNILLPYPLKFVGLILTLSGIIAAALFIWFDFRFTMPLFAVFSSFIETKTFTTSKTNFADELAMLLIISGLGLLVFSKERIEYENLNLFRTKALTRACIANTIFIFLSVLFVYGSEFIGILVLNLFSFMFFYLFFFYLLERKN